MAPWVQNSPPLQKDGCINKPTLPYKTLLVISLVNGYWESNKLLAHPSRPRYQSIRAINMGSCTPCIQFLYKSFSYPSCIFFCQELPDNYREIIRPSCSLENSCILPVFLFFPIKQSTSKQMVNFCTHYSEHHDATAPNCFIQSQSQHGTYTCSSLAGLYAPIND